MPIDLEFNSALGNQTYFYQKCGSCTQKSNETWNLKIRVKTKKKHLWLKGYRWKVVGPKSLYIQDLRIHGSSTGQSRFSFWSFNFWPRSNFYQKKRSKSAKSSPIFHLKGRRDTSWQFLDSPMWDFFPPKLLFLFLIWPSSSGGKRGPKVGQKWKLWVSPATVKIWVFQKFLKHRFCFLEYYLCWKF